MSNQNNTINNNNAHNRGKAIGGSSINSEIGNARTIGGSVVSKKSNNDKANDNAIISSNASSNQAKTSSINGNINSLGNDNSTNYLRNRPRRWFTDGVSMNFPPLKRAVYWFINLLLYVLLNMFYLRIQTGSWLQWSNPYNSQSLIEQLLHPLNIFQFPSYILIIASLTALICTIPILIAQLYNLLYALPFVLALLFLGHNSALSLALFVSIAAASFEPLRFKSKFVAIILCLLPEIFYCWVFSGVNPEQNNVLRWAVLYVPWALAFLISLVLVALVLSLGHILRYRPGIIMPFFGLLLAGTVTFFNHTIGMNERDFQDLVAQYNPAIIPQFQDRSITALLEREKNIQRKVTPYFNDKAIMNQLRFNWKLAFSHIGLNPLSLADREAITCYRTRVIAIESIDRFIAMHPDDPKIANALYYKAMLIDMKVDIKALQQDDMLRFYFDIPSPEAQPIWQEILDKYPQHPSAIVARYRLARILAARRPQNITDPFFFDKARNLLDQASKQCSLLLKKQQAPKTGNAFWANLTKSVFTAPATLLSNRQLWQLQMKIYYLKNLIGPQNRTGHRRQDERLADFVALNPHAIDYETQLNKLMVNAPKPDPLQDNIELAQTLLITNLDNKIMQLKELIKQFPNSDSTPQMRLALAKALLEQRKQTSHLADQQLLLNQATIQLQNIITQLPDTVIALAAQKLLQQNPLK